MRLRQAIENHARDVVIRTRSDMEREIAQAAPIRTGELRRGVRVRLGSTTGTRLSLRAESTAPHSSFVITGTAPHLIRPRRPGGVLVFTSRGRVVRTRIVRHPGTKPNDFFHKPMAQRFHNSLLRNL